MTDPQPLTTQQYDEIQDLADNATPGPWHLTLNCEIAAPLTSDTIADVWEPTQASRNGEFIAAARTAVPALLADNQHLRQQLEEMTRCRDNALRALYRDDVETDIDLEETIAAPFYGPGWDWDEPDLKRVASVAADAVRPAFGKLTQERDTLRASLAETRAKTLVEEADLIVAHCPDHGTADGVWMDCHCPVADDMRHRAAARPAATTQDNQP